MVTSSCRGRFVRNHSLGLQGNRHGDHHTLVHTRRHLVCGRGGQPFSGSGIPTCSKQLNRTFLTFAGGRHAKDGPAGPSRKFASRRVKTPGSVMTSFLKKSIAKSICRQSCGRAWRPSVKQVGPVKRSARPAVTVSRPGQQPINASMDTGFTRTRFSPHL